MLIPAFAWSVFTAVFQVGHDSFNFYQEPHGVSKPEWVTSSYLPISWLFFSIGVVVFLIFVLRKALGPK